jgi:hypothetical protein
MLTNEQMLCEVTFCGGTAPYVPAARETSAYESEDEAKRETAPPTREPKPAGRVMVIGFRVIRI